MLAFGVLSLTACDALPGAPDADPDSWIPSIAPSDLLGDRVDSIYGYSPNESAAVRVRNEACDEIGTGSGFIIDDHTIVTNRHVVDGYATLEVSTSDGRDLTVSSVSTVSIADLAFVTVAESLDNSVPLSSTDPAAGDDVTVVGYPQGDQMTTTTGVVIRSEDDPLDNADHVWLTSAKVQPGSSGSAAYNNAGEVFGVVYATEGYMDRGYIIPISLLQAAIDDGSIVSELAPSCSR
jgi:S1-C subfamily serine protease